MKSSANSKIIILITLGILFAFSPIITTNLSLITGSSNKSSEYNKNLQISAVSGKIHIINNSGWVTFRSAGNCTGNGTYSEPYVIEDLVIDGEGSGNCIEIENSDVFFKIENCTVYNSGDSPNAGIRLSYVNNSQLINNNCSSNYYGIRLSSSKYNNISGNTARNNTFCGILLSSSNYNNISGNNASFNTYHGIWLHYSQYNDISGNTANNNYRNGILLFDSDNNIISGNNASYNTNNGIWLSSSNYNNISGNNASYNTYLGIELTFSNYNDISGNNASYNTYFGIYLRSSDNNIIVINTINNNSVGIKLYHSMHNEVLNNSFSGNGEDIQEVSSNSNGDQFPLEIAIIIVVILIVITMSIAGMLITRRRLSRDKVISDEESGAIEITDEGIISLFYISVTLLIIGCILSLVSFLHLRDLVYPISYVGVIIGIIGLVGIIAYKLDPEKMKKYYYLSRAMLWIGWTLFIVFYFGIYIFFWILYFIPIVIGVIGLCGLLLLIFKPKKYIELRKKRKRKEKMGRRNLSIGFSLIGGLLGIIIGIFLGLWGWGHPMFYYMAVISMVAIIGAIIESINRIVGSIICLISGITILITLNIYIFLIIIAPLPPLLIIVGGVLGILEGILGILEARKAKKS